MASLHGGNSELVLSKRYVESKRHKYCACSGNLCENYTWRLFKAFTDALCLFFFKYIFLFFHFILVSPLLAISNQPHFVSRLVCSPSFFRPLYSIRHQHFSTSECTTFGIFRIRFFQAHFYIYISAREFDRFRSFLIYQKFPALEN